MLRKLALLAVMVVAMLGVAMPASADVETHGIVTPVGYWLVMATANPLTQSGGVGSVITFDVEAYVGLACVGAPPCVAPPGPVDSFEVSFDGIYGLDAAKFSKTGGDTGIVIVDDETSFNAIITCDTSEVGTFTAQIYFEDVPLPPLLKSNTVSKVVTGESNSSFVTITCIVTETGAVVTVAPSVTSENTETGAPLRVYCSDSGKTFFIYRSVGNTGELEFISTESEVEDAGIPSGTPVVIEESDSGDIVLYRLSNGQYMVQMFVPDPVIGGKVYSFVWGPCAYGKNGARGFFTP
ncbi:MAG: hypothetical protein SFZ02_05300 [bacterium]|nr:hypothetical protein [bacterium]